MNKRNITATILTVIAVTMAQAQAIQMSAPKLVVNITVDQLRTDNLEKYSYMYCETGLKRLLQEGAIYSSARFSFAPVDKASAIAAIMTGTTPYYNGITGSQWFDRSTLRPRPTVDNSPENILVSTISDEMKVCTDGQAKVYSISTNSQTAILAAGHSADAALWMDESGKWSSSSYYQSVTPRWVDSYNELNKPKKDRTSKNDMVTKMALQCIINSGMGYDAVCDMLSVNYSTDDDPLSYADIDRNVSELLIRIGERMSLDEVVFVMSSTGYIEKEQQAYDYQKYRVPTGTFYINRTANLLNMYLGAIYGNGRYVEACFRNQLFFNTKLLEQRNIAMGEVLSRSQEFLMLSAGVRNVFTRENLINQNTSNEKVRNGYNHSICGDILIEVAPGWSLLNEDTHECFQHRASFVNYPVIIFGNGIKAGRVDVPVDINRLAPTIAKSIRIRAPNACREEPLL